MNIIGGAFLGSFLMNSIAIQQKRDALRAQHRLEVSSAVLNAQLTESELQTQKAMDYIALLNKQREVDQQTRQATANKIVEAAMTGTMDSTKADAEISMIYNTAANEHNNLFSTMYSRDAQRETEKQKALAGIALAEQQTRVPDSLSTILGIAGAGVSAFSGYYAATAKITPDMTTTTQTSTPTMFDTSIDSHADIILSGGN